METTYETAARLLGVCEAEIQKALTFQDEDPGVQPMSTLTVEALEGAVRIVETARRLVARFERVTGMSMATLSEADIREVLVEHFAPAEFEG